MQQGFARIEKYLAQKNFPNAVSVAIVHQGKMCWEYHSGSVDPTTPLVKPTRHTIYRVGSVSKTFCVAVLLRAAQLNLLRLDEPVSQCVPDFQPQNVFNTEQITWKQLASNTSGLPRLTFDCTLPLRAPAVLSNLKGHRLIQAPGSPMYSNVAFALVAHLVAEFVFKRDYCELLKELFLVPLGMSNTGFDCTDEVKSKMAQGYGPKGPIPKGFPDIGWYSPAGAMYSTTEDLAKWLCEWMGCTRQNGEKSFFHDQTKLWDSVYTDPEGGTSQGIPWENIQIGDAIFHRKYGDILGYSATIGMLPKHDLGITFLAGTEKIDAREVVTKVMFLLLNSINPSIQEPALVPAQYTVPASEDPDSLQIYCGDYSCTHPLMGPKIITIKLEDGLLTYLSEEDQERRFLVRSTVPNDQHTFQIFYAPGQIAWERIRDEPSSNNEFLFFALDPNSETPQIESLFCPGIYGDGFRFFKDSIE